MNVGRAVYYTNKKSNLITKLTYKLYSNYSLFNEGAVYMDYGCFQVLQGPCRVQEPDRDYY